MIRSERVAALGLRRATEVVADNLLDGECGPPRPETLDDVRGRQSTMMRHVTRVVRENRCGALCQSACERFDLPSVPSIQVIEEYGPSHVALLLTANASGFGARTVPNGNQTRRNPGLPADLPDAMGRIVNGIGNLRINEDIDPVEVNKPLKGSEGLRRPPHRPDHGAARSRVTRVRHQNTAPAGNSEYRRLEMRRTGRVAMRPAG
jgi:hypothetical protein